MRPGPRVSCALLAPQSSTQAMASCERQQRGGGAEPGPCQHGSFVWGPCVACAVQSGRMRDAGMRDAGALGGTLAPRAAPRSCAWMRQTLNPMQICRQSPGNPRAMAGPPAGAGSTARLGGLQVRPWAWLRPGHGAAVSVHHAAPGPCPVPRPARGVPELLCGSTVALGQPREQALSKRPQMTGCRHVWWGSPWK